MKRYEKYKPSGISWLPVIPAHWEEKRLATHFHGRVEANSDFEYKRAFKFNYGTIVPKNEIGKPEEYKDVYVKYSKVLKDDILVNGLNLNYDFISQRVAIVPEPGIITSAYVVLRPFNSTFAKYFCYLFKGMDSQKLFHGMGTGIRLTLSFSDLKRQLIPIPSIQEQKQIVSFLDCVTSKIDSCISSKEKELKYLTELKQSVIGSAVTRGLNANVELRDSGLAWIGLIPSHWGKVKVSRLYDVQLGKMLQPEQKQNTDTYEYYLCAANVGKNQLKYEPKKQMWFSEKEKEQYSLSKGDLLVVEGGDVGSCAIIDCQVDGLYFQNALHRVRSKGLADIDYLRYVLNYAKSIGHIDYLCNKATIAHFTKDKLQSLIIPFPPVKEQREIVDFIETKTRKIDLLIESIQLEINKLVDYKQRIIIDAVTGQIDVRSAYKA